MEKHQLQPIKIKIPPRKLALFSSKGFIQCDPKRNKISSRIRGLKIGKKYFVNPLFAENKVVINETCNKKNLV